MSASKHPFKAGDKVYHIQAGELVVRSVEGPNIKCQMVGGSNYLYYEPTRLSFSPWPKPDWERKVEEGLYVVRLNVSHELLLRYVKGKTVYLITYDCKPGVVSGNLSEYTIIQKIELES